MFFNRGMDKEDVVIYAMKYYSAIEKNNMMPFAATWIDLDIVILSEASEKDKFMILLINGVFEKLQMNLSTKHK